MSEWYVAFWLGSLMGSIVASIISVYWCRKKEKVWKTLETYSTEDVGRRMAWAKPNVVHAPHSPMFEPKNPDEVRMLMCSFCNAKTRHKVEFVQFDAPLFQENAHEAWVCEDCSLGLQLVVHPGKEYFE